MSHNMLHDVVLYKNFIEMFLTKEKLSICVYIYIYQRSFFIKIKINVVKRYIPLVKRIQKLKEKKVMLDWYLLLFGKTYPPLVIYTNKFDIYISPHVI